MKFQHAIAAQGVNLRQSRPLVDTALSAIDLGPWRRGRLALTGMGASSHALLPTVASMIAHGRPVVALSADELAPFAAAGLIDSVVGVSQEGTSTETLEALTAVGSMPRLVITNAVESRAALLADALIPLGLLEDSAVYTLGYTAALQALGLLAAALRDEEPDASWAVLPIAVEEVLEAARLPVDELAERLGTPRVVDLVGSGSHLAAAGEGALILREASRLPTSCHSTRQYLHGPMESLDKGQMTIVFGDRREIDLALDISRTGAHAVLVTTAAVPPAVNLTVLRLPPVGTALPVLEILPIQLLAAQMAARQGLAVEGFRYEQSDTKVPRHPAHLSPRARGDLRVGSLGIDVGGSKVAVALSSGDQGDIEFWGELPTPPGGNAEVLRVTGELVDRAVAAAGVQQIEIAGVGVAVPELVWDGRIMSQAVVPGLDADEWAARFGPIAPTIIEADVRAAALGEAICGAGRSSSSFCFVSVGTGISYCLVQEGGVLRGAHGAAILLGSSVTAEWDVDGQRRQWILEQLASGPALLALYAELGGPCASPEQILSAYGQDPSATRAVDEAARALGIGLALAVNLLDPEVVVVGGGLGSAGGVFWDLSVQSAREHIWCDWVRPLPLCQAELGARAGAIGAAIIGRRHGLAANGTIPHTTGH